MEYVEDYLNTLISEGKSATTKKNYKQDLKQFFKAVPKNAADVSKLDVRRFFDALTAKGAAPATRNRYKASVSGYFKWCILNDILTKNPAETIKTVKTPKTLPEFLTEAELARVFDDAPTLFHKTVVHVLYSTGARISELCALDKDDIDLESRKVNIRHGKGDKQRFVRLTHVAKDLLTQYWAERGDDRPEAFLNQHGNRLQPGNVQEYLRKVRKRLGLAKKTNPHKFRKTLASHMVQRGIGIQIVGELLGHSNLDTTRIYAALVDDQRNKAFDDAIDSTLGTQDA